MNKIKYRVWEPVNKSFYYPKLSLYESGEENGAAMSLDVVEVELGIDVTGVCHDVFTAYEGDIVSYNPYGDNDIIGVVKFGQYEQDGSGGEYTPKLCYGFYIDRIYTCLNEWDDPDNVFEPEYLKTSSLIYYDIKRIGNIHENPEKMTRL